MSLASLKWRADKSVAAAEALTAALPLNTLAQHDAAAKHTHTLHTLHNREETDRFVLADKFSPQNAFEQTHRFLILLFRAAGFLGFLNDCIEREAQAAHAWQVSHVYVELQLLIPQRLRAHRHLRGCHHLTEVFATMEQTGLYHELEGKHTHAQ